MDAEIARALDAVHDPCSVAAGRPMGLLRMGLVLGWTMEPAGRLVVRLCVTSPACTMAPHFVLAARDALEKIAGEGRVEVQVDPAFIWTPDRIGADARCAPAA